MWWPSARLSHRFARDDACARRFQVAHAAVSATRTRCFQSKWARRECRAWCDRSAVCRTRHASMAALSRRTQIAARAVLSEAASSMASSRRSKRSSRRACHVKSAPERAWLRRAAAGFRRRLVPSAALLQCFMRQRRQPRWRAPHASSSSLRKSCRPAASTQLWKARATRRHGVAVIDGSSDCSSSHVNNARWLYFATCTGLVAVWRLGLRSGRWRYRGVGTERSTVAWAGTVGCGRRNSSASPTPNGACCDSDCLKRRRSRSLGSTLHEAQSRVNFSSLCAASSGLTAVFPRTLFFGMSQNEFSKTRSTRPFCTSGTGAKRRVEHKSSSRAQDAEKFPVANLLVFYVRSAPLQSNDSSGKSRNNMNAVWRGCDELNLTEGWSRDWRRDNTRDLVEQNW